MSFALSVTQPAPSCTEHELVEAVREGSDEAFEELYARYRARIAAFIFSRVGDHARAEDLVQEVFISALRRLRATDQELAFKPWIYEIAKNACIDEFRRTRRTREIPLVGGAEPEDGGEAEWARSDVTTEGEVETRQSLADLRGAFYGLSETQHKIIVMRELAGLSYAEIGHRLDMSQAMVESNLFRARRRLTEEYNELTSGRRCQSVQTIIGLDDPVVVRKLGLRQRRQVARHLAHCQSCRREARLAGLDESFFKAPTRIGKIAALLPLPWLRWPRSGPDEDATAATGSSHGISALGPLQNVARWFDASAPLIGIGRAATALAALALAAVGGGVATTVAGHPGPPTPPRISTVSASAGAGGTAAATRTAHKRAVRSGASSRVSGRHRSSSAGKSRGGKSGTAGGSKNAAAHRGAGTGGSSGSAKHAGSSRGSGGSTSSTGSTGSSGSSTTSHVTNSSPQLPVVSSPHTVSVGGVTVTTPTVTAPKVPVPTVHVPTPKVQVPSPTKVVKKILGG